jgi:hypothetical protein
VAFRNATAVEFVTFGPFQTPPMALMIEAWDLSSAFWGSAASGWRCSDTEVSAKLAS